MYKTKKETICALSEKLHKYISGTDTLILLSGGSSVLVSIKALSLLSVDDRKHITIGMTDERYGTFFHTNSNWRHLYEAGLDNLGISKIYPILSKENFSFEESVALYDKTLDELLSEFSKSIGIFGIGTDNHIAGILPNSMALNEENAMVYGYDTAQFKRITMTLPAIRRLQNIFVYAEGKEKKDAVESLNQTFSVFDHPNQIVKMVPDYSVFYCLEN